MFQFPMTVPPCILAFFRMAGRRKNDPAPNRIGRIRYGSAGKIESAACYLQTSRINWRLNFVIQPLLHAHRIDSFS